MRPAPAFPNSRSVAATALTKLGKLRALAAILPAAALFSAVVVASAAQAADGCGPGCHAAVNGGCVVNGWESGAVAWNECPAGAHPHPPCGSYYVWRKHSNMCMRLN